MDVDHDGIFSTRQKSDNFRPNFFFEDNDRSNFCIGYVKNYAIKRHCRATATQRHRWNRRYRRTRDVDNDKTEIRQKQLGAEMNGGGDEETVTTNGWCERVMVRTHR